MPRWPHDDPASLAAFYGDPAKGEPGKQLVPVVPPFTMYYAGQPVPRIMFHKKAAAALLAALTDIWEHYGRDQATLDRLRISHYDGAYNRRYVRGYEPNNAFGRTPRWSNHAFGAAIDFDAEHNKMGAGRGTIPQPVIDAFKRQGALWGGDYRGRTDPMHFEFCSREPIAQPMAFAGDVQADGDSDQGGDDAPAQAAKPSAGGFVGRARNWIVGMFSGVGFTSLGALTSWEIAVVLLAAIFIFVACGFGVALWLFGKQRVADWVARHLA
ncbi:M15 family metallopeptidase [Bradyrhizobium elkanii]|uniref:Peptidase M15C domain-containing protein n=1 Tax=Bradyrhizobium elkanii TaxID=29448 RepID=A0A8I1YAY5_BRAEL|nr:M15 family metallopeptidase [Bradyrhizobium elkanii]MBP1296608.1 hypothetical protein [Bradyrhizobium elkanii]